MRLLNTTSLEFEVFSDDHLPPYAILSHTWGDEEVSYQDMRFLHKRLALPDHLRDNEILVTAIEAAAGISRASIAYRRFKPGFSGREDVLGR
jgi:hypothetical protein